VASAAVHHKQAVDCGASPLTTPAREQHHVVWHWQLKRVPSRAGEQPPLTIDYAHVAKQLRAPSMNDAQVLQQGGLPATLTRPKNVGNLTQHRRGECFQLSTHEQRCQRDRWCLEPTVRVGEALRTVTGFAAVAQVPVIVRLVTWPRKTL
jgi:hypothetical protein